LHRIGEEKVTVMNQPYKRPPITEAVIEFRPKQPLDIRLISKAEAKFRKNYPLSQNFSTMGVRVNPAMQSADVHQEYVGHRLCTNDQTDILTITTASFAVARLAPYPGWDVFRKRAEEDWHQWKSIVGSHQLNRIGIRYINRIDIPVEPTKKIDLDEYLKCFPELPNDSFKALTHYAMQLVLPLEDNCQAIINTGSVPAPLLNHASFILDFDISREINLPQRDDEIWNLIDKIREYKNYIFEQCITDKARALFNE